MIFVIAPIGSVSFLNKRIEKENANWLYGSGEFSEEEIAEIQNVEGKVFSDREAFAEWRMPHCLLTGTAEDPRGLNYNLFGLIKKRTFVAGELTEIDYYKTMVRGDPTDSELYESVSGIIKWSGTEEYQELCVKETREYVRDSTGLYLVSSPRTAYWYGTDNSLFVQKKWVKEYVDDAAVTADERRRANLIKEAKRFLWKTLLLAFPGTNIDPNELASDGMIYAGFFQNSSKEFVIQYKEGLTTPLTSYIESCGSEHTFMDFDLGLIDISLNGITIANAVNRILKQIVSQSTTS